VPAGSGNPELFGTNIGGGRSLAARGRGRSASGGQYAVRGGGPFGAFRDSLLPTTFLATPPGREEGQGDALKPTARYLIAAHPIIFPGSGCEVRSGLGRVEMSCLAWGRRSGVSGGAIHQRARLRRRLRIDHTTGEVSSR